MAVGVTVVEVAPHVTETAPHVEETPTVHPSVPYVTHSGVSASNNDGQTDDSGAADFVVVFFISVALSICFVSFLKWFVDRL
jgi:hypothetical protein